NGKTKGGVDLRLRRFMLKETKDGDHPLVPGDLKESLMLDVVKSGEMPKEGKRLAPDDVAKIEHWIAQGAKTLRDEPAEVPKVWISEDERAWWSFQPIAHPVPPPV